MEQCKDVSPGSLTNDSYETIDYQLEFPAWSIESLKHAAIQQKSLRPRSLAWAIMLNALPTTTGDILTSIRRHRNFYNDLKSKLSMDPRAVIGDDPLSQNDESAWRQHFCDNELKAVILQDVVRTFPDELYFRESDVQGTMVRVLFFWARSHSHVGYRQGMHEILAPVLFELYIDRKFAPKEISDKLKIILDEDYLEHDSYMLFSAIMKGLEKFYVTGDIVPSSTGRMPASKHIHNPNEVVRYLEKLKEEYLTPLDPELSTHLSECKISLELFGIRWLRLLFGREFPRSEVPHLWGFVFSDGPTLPNLHYIVVAMLISIRTTLLDPDPGVVLSALMRPVRLSVGHVCALALHLQRPLDYPKPPAPAHYEATMPATMDDYDMHNNGTSDSATWGMEIRGSSGAGSGCESGSEGVPEGADVARELAALAVLRAHLPSAAAALASALPRPPPHIQQPLQQILHLAALLQCRNHALVDVETALEAAEGNSNEKIKGRRTLVPVAMLTPKKQQKHTKQNKIKEVPLKVFHEIECDEPSDLPSLDPLRLRTG